MRATFTLLVAVLLPGLAPAQSKWPITPLPMPSPAVPVSVGVIEEDEWFVIERDSPAVALCSPAGFVSFKYVSNSESCPVRYKGKFAGSGGKKEEKTFTGKFLIEVTALKTGRCELFLVPETVKAEADVERRTVDVKAGEGGQPPPVDPVPPVTDKFYFLLVRPDGPALPAFTKAMELPAWNELRTKGHLIKDKTLTESAAFNVTIPNGTALPCVVTLKYNADGKTMSQVRVGPFPTTNDAIAKLPEAK